MCLHVKNELMDNDECFYVLSFANALLPSNPPNMNDAPLIYICSWISRCKSPALVELGILNSSLQISLKQSLQRWCKSTRWSITQWKMQPAHLLQSFRSALRSWFVCCSGKLTNISPAHIKIERQRVTLTSICGVYCLYVGCEIHNVPANKMESVHLRFILCLHLNLIQMQTQIIFERGENMRPSSWQYRFRGVREPPTTLQQQDKVRLLISFEVTFDWHLM